MYSYYICDIKVLANHDGLASILEMMDDSDLEQITLNLDINASVNDIIEIDDYKAMYLGLDDEGYYVLVDESVDENDDY